VKPKPATRIDTRGRKQPAHKSKTRDKKRAPAPSKSPKKSPSQARDEEIVQLAPLLRRHWEDVPALLADAVPAEKRQRFIEDVARKLNVPIEIVGAFH
jgi:hypothetical protein